MRNFCSLAVVAAVFSVISFTSCADDKKESVVENFVISPIKKPDFIAYSGHNMIGSSFMEHATKAANVNGNLWYQNWERPVNVTDQERDKVVEEFSKVREGEHNTIQVTWHDFWVQQVYKGEATYTDGYGSSIGRGSDHMNHLLAFNNIKTTVISWWPYEEAETAFEGAYEHINNFNSGNNTTDYTDDVTHEHFYGTTLMTNIGTDGRDEQFGYHNSTDSKDHYEYIILKIDGSYYIGFDFFANGTVEYPANKNMDVDRDWIFNDWIVKISPAQRIGAEPVDPDLEGGSGSGGEDPIFIPTPSDGEVEVNLSVNDKLDDGDYIATKLSIHVRDTTDVEIYIPVPAQFYCNADDMYIIINHQIQMAYGNTEVTYDIDGSEVKSIVQFEEGGIRITTQGITAQVLRYLRDNYFDGVSFEIWNYYNETVSRDELKPYLDNSTVDFKDNNPGQYVNAISALNGVANPWDCTVKPVSDVYGDPVKGLHYNNSEFNDIYTR